MGCDEDLSLPVDSAAGAPTNELRLSKHVYESVSGKIIIDPICLKLMDAEQFRRLREHKQLGGTRMVYPGAVHSRFEPSLGVYWLAGEPVMRLKPFQGLVVELDADADADRYDLQTVGRDGILHVPFRHTFERDFLPRVISGCQLYKEDECVKKKMRVQKKRKFTRCGGSVDETDSSEEDEMEDETDSSEEDEMEDGNSLLMRVPRRSEVLLKHPKLKDKSGITISSALAKSCLDAERYKYLLEEKPDQEKLFFSDSKGKMVIYWKPESMDEEGSLSDKITRRRIRTASGYVWDQFQHPICWAFVSADLISASLVLYGWEPEYIPFCPRYLYEALDVTLYNKTRKSGHKCYPHDVGEALKFVQTFGIQKSRLQRGVEFDCTEATDTEEVYGHDKEIEIFHYPNLKQALPRLKTHPVAATLHLFDGWDDEDVYRGPKNGAASVVGLPHKVLMLDTRKINGEMVVKCKSSNGVDLGRKGFIYVSTEIMFITVAGEEGRKYEKWCPRRPTHLLSGFYSVGMKMGHLPPQFDERIEQAQENDKYKVRKGDYVDMDAEAEEENDSMSEAPDDEETDSGSEGQDDDEEVVRVLGIHLGTTNSCVCIGAYSYVDKRGLREIIPNDQGNRVTPSWVGFTDSKRLVGEAAKNQAAVNSERTVFDIKRLIGRKFEDKEVQEVRKLVPYRIVNKDGKPYIRVKIKDGETKVFSPEEISAMILTKMKETAEAYLGKKIKDAVVTVPAYFNDAQRQATKDAGVIAGLNVITTIREPCAVDHAFGLEEKGVAKNILVFHLGGGTCEVAVLYISDEEYKILSQNGDTNFGGNDFDERVVNHFINIMKNKYGKDISKDKKAVSKLRAKCERAKRSLSSRDQVRIKSISLTEGVEEFSETLTRASFEELNKDLFEKILGFVERALDDASLKKKEIDVLALVGGSSWIPKVQQLLTNFFGGKEPLVYDPDFVAAHGAARCGIALLREARDLAAQENKNMEVDDLSKT